MPVQILFVLKSIPEFFCRATAIDAVSLHILRHDRSRRNDSAVTDTDAAHNNRPVTYPDIVSDLRNLAESLPAIILVPYLRSQPDRNPDLLKKMVILPDYSHFIAEYYIVFNDAISFYLRIPSDIKALSDHQFVPGPQSYPCTSMESFAYFIIPPFYFH